MTACVRPHGAGETMSVKEVVLSLLGFIVYFVIWAYTRGHRIAGLDVFEAMLTVAILVGLIYYHFKK